MQTRQPNQPSDEPAETASTSVEPVQRPGTVTATAGILYVTAGLTVLACCGIDVAFYGITGPSTGLLLVNTLLIASATLNVWLASHILDGRQWARITLIVLAMANIASISLVPTSRLVWIIPGIILNVLVVGLLISRTANAYFRALG